jgi:hypothetical protein
MSTPAYTEREIKNFVIKWSIEYFEVAKADQPYVRVDHISKIGEEEASSLDEWELRVWYTEDKYAIVYVGVNDHNELAVTQVDY